MTAFLLDEMFPTGTAVMLRETYGHDAVHVAEIGLGGPEEAQVGATARAEAGALVTENVADFASERDIVLAFLLKKNLPAGGGQEALRWRRSSTTRLGTGSPEWKPYLGHHWLRSHARAYFRRAEASSRLLPVLLYFMHCL